MSQTNRRRAWLLPDVQVTIKFPVPLGKLEKFCAEKQVSVVHVAVKAVAMALRAVPQVGKGREAWEVRASGAHAVVAGVDGWAACS